MKLVLLLECETEEQAQEIVKRLTEEKLAKVVIAEIEKETSKQSYMLVKRIFP